MQDDLSYNQAAGALNIKYPHLMRLLREGVLERTSTGRVSAKSVQGFLAENRPPLDYVSAAYAAGYLGIAKAHVPALVRAGLVRGMELANALGGTWVNESDLMGLDMIRVAELGIKVPAPTGYLSSGHACKRLDVSRSGLRSLVQQGLIKVLAWSAMNTFYAEESVAKLVVTLRR